ncbi:MAG: hypothetical protein GVY33_11505 [Alphaproteobacteria bacterium]|jgi:hypothetical protein|nr:hypothetical protein [Alphaproteobacteria bacterium]
MISRRTTLFAGALGGGFFVQSAIPTRAVARQPQERLRAWRDFGRELLVSGECVPADVMAAAAERPFRPPLELLLMSEGNSPDAGRLVERVEAAVDYRELAVIGGYLFPADFQRIGVFVASWMSRS